MLSFFLHFYHPSTHPIYIFLNTTDFIDNLLDRSQEEIGKREKVTRTLLKHEKERRQRTNKNTYGQRNTVELPTQVRFLKQRNKSLKPLWTISNKSHSTKQIVVLSRKGCIVSILMYYFSLKLFLQFREFGQIKIYFIVNK